MGKLSRMMGRLACGRTFTVIPGTLPCPPEPLSCHPELAEGSLFYPKTNKTKNEISRFARNDNGRACHPECSSVSCCFPCHLERSERSLTASGTKAARVGSKSLFLNQRPSRLGYAVRDPSPSAQDDNGRVCLSACGSG